MQLLMEKTEKFFCTEEDFAEKLIEERKEGIDEGMLIDYKLSIKELKDSTYYIVTLKTRYLTLPEAKEQL